MFYKCFCKRGMIRCFYNRTVISYNLSIDYPKWFATGLNAWDEELTNTVKHNIESHWRNQLKEIRYDEDSKQLKFYVLSMFPYPSGNLHMGHVRVYTISDTVARFYRMKGFNVFHPMGWDAFGLPAENAALERGVAADKWTRLNIDTMRNQLKALGCCFEWDREVATCHPGYYRFTQEIFLRIYEAGLVYRNEALVNWDPVDKTVLADEQVGEDGRSWRSGAQVEKKLLNQWFIRTTRFASALLSRLEHIRQLDWKDIINLQRHWIGECDGASFDFPVLCGGKSDRLLNIWTSCPEHIDTATFVAVAPRSVLDCRETGDCPRKLNMTVRNPFTDEVLPVFVTCSVEYDKGRDVRLGMPRVFETDRDFALSVGLSVDSDCLVEEDKEKRERVCEMARKAGIGGYATSSKLRDWLVSRQRYWGTPIPMIHCSSCGAQPVPYEQLPVELPPLDDAVLHQQAVKDNMQWKATTCPKCGGYAERETDTMDTFVDSSWYFLRYADARNPKIPFDRDKVAKLMPVDLYVGGKEHAVLHLYYARFLGHFLHSIGWLDTPEPFQRLLVQGMVMGKSYRVKESGRYISKEEIHFADGQITEEATGASVVESWEKMSKSKHNGVDPNDILEEYGIDTTRLLILANVAPTSHRNWSTDTFPGVLNWQRRLWQTVQELHSARRELTIERCPTFAEQEAYLWDSRNFYLKVVTSNMEHTQHLSVAISKMQGLTNSIRRSSRDVVALSGQYERALALQVIMLAPFVPHFASELWAGLQSAEGRIDLNPGEIAWDHSVLQQNWPVIDLDYTMMFICKVNGAVKCKVKVIKRELDNLSQIPALELALAQPQVQSSMAGLSLTGSKYHAVPGFDSTIDILAEKKKETLEASSEARSM